MEGLTTKEWLYKRSGTRSVENEEKITARANNTPSKKVTIRISIGLIICSLLELNKGDRVEIFLNKKDRDIMLIRKSLHKDEGYKLSHSLGSRYLTFDFICTFKSEFKIKQTITLAFDFNSKNIILNLSKLRWEK
jgi:hypothetical protein